MTDRRRFMVSLGALAAAPALARFGSYPFALGVASGYPGPASVVLWTRLMGELEPAPIRVRWEIASDERMRTIVNAGEILADPAWAHSARVEVQGLAPERWYWYRFSAGDAQSPIGRTRTAPPTAAAVPRLRFAFASCQQYEHGWYGAYRHIVADAPDLIVFLGDYIYEASWGRERVRSHGDGEAVTLEDYRRRYALYKTDPDLQAAHAACPWLLTWDDHEVENDYGNDRSQGLDAAQWSLARRAGAYKAWYEHQPVPRAMVPFGAQARIYTRSAYGTLAEFFVLDERQHRSPRACPRAGGRGSNLVDPAQCAALADPSRTLLGETQEQWLAAGLAASRARWTIVAQQTRMAQLDQHAGEGRSAWNDGWDGYPAARRRLLESLARKRNGVVIGGDIHAFQVGELKLDFDDAKAPVVASELIGTSLTSQGWSQKRLDALRAENPHVLLADSRHRGYVRVEVTPGLLRADLRAMEHVRTREAGCSTLASFVVEDGRPGPQPAS